LTPVAVCITVFVLWTLTSVYLAVQTFRDDIAEVRSEEG
jgi:hypothetical protein